MLESITTFFVVAVTVMVILFDILIAALQQWLGGGERATITAVIIKYSRKYPVIPFAFGFLMGHFFGDF